MYEFASRIRYSETDPDGRLNIESLIDYFQDCSTFQTESVGAGLSYLKEQHLIWILNAWQIDIFRLPELYEHVRIGTMPYLLKGFAGHRNFYMDTEDGERLAEANSLWSLFDTEKNYPSRIAPEHAARYELDEKLDMTYCGRKIALPDTEGVRGADIVVHRAHLDSNGHVNNGQYVRMAMEALEETEGGRAYEKDIHRLRAEYKKQTFPGDILTPYIYRGKGEDGQTLRTVHLMCDGESACIVELS